jgi:uncharacterized RDD family membrane protein YckC
MTPEEQKMHREMMQNMAPVSEYDLRIGFGRRLGAAILDMIFTTIIMLIVFIATGIMEEFMRLSDSLTFTSQEDMQLFSEYLTNTVAPISLIISLIYYITEVLFAASPGKMVLGIKIASAGRKEALMEKLFIRYAVKHSNNILSALSLLALSGLFDVLSTIAFLVILVGFFFTLSYKRQAFHDMAAGTAVYFNDEVIETEDEGGAPIE